MKKLLLLIIGMFSVVVLSQAKPPKWAKKLPKPENQSYFYSCESAADENGYLSPVSGETDIFIYPGYKFKVLDCLITNFHLPESTLVMLVSALAGRDNVLNAYNEAIKERYRFFSFGDCMFIS